MKTFFVGVIALLVVQVEAKPSITALPLVTKHVHENGDVDSKGRLWITSNSGLFCWEGERWRQIDSRPCTMLRVVGDRVYVRASKQPRPYEPAVYSTSGKDLRFECTLHLDLMGAGLAKVGVDDAGRVYIAGRKRVAVFQRNPDGTDVIALANDEGFRDADPQIVIDGDDVYLCTHDHTRWYHKGVMAGQLQHSKMVMYYGTPSLMPLKPGLLLRVPAHQHKCYILDLKNKRVVELEQFPQDVAALIPDDLLQNEDKLVSWFNECIRYHIPGKPMALTMLLEKWKPEEVVAGVKARRKIDFKYVYSRMASHGEDVVEINRDGTITTNHDGEIAVLEVGLPELGGSFRRAVVDSKGNYYFITRNKIIRYRPESRSVGNTKDNP